MYSITADYNYRLRSLQACNEVNGSVTQQKMLLVFIRIALPKQFLLVSPPHAFKDKKNLLLKMIHDKFILISPLKVSHCQVRDVCDLD